MDLSTTRSGPCWRIWRLKPVSRTGGKPWPDCCGRTNLKRRPATACAPPFPNCVRLSATGQPTRGVSGATVTAPDACTADMLATAVIVMGMEDGIAFLENYDDVEGMLVSDKRDILTTSGFKYKKR